MTWPAKHILGFILALVSLACSNVACAQNAETVEADVSARSVTITSSFSGTEIIVFGAVENSKQPSAEAGTYDVVVVVEGTPLPLVVRKKSKFAGLWINMKSVRFASLPSYYAIASTRPIDEISDISTLEKNEIGFGSIRMTPVGKSRTEITSPEDIKEFRDSVIRLKQKDRLYLTADYGVAFIGRSLFRSTISLPPNVPVGPLLARVYLFKEGKLLSEHKSNVELERAGLERVLHDSAFNSPWFYGVGTLCVASLAGLLAAFAFRRSVH